MENHTAPIRFPGANGHGACTSMTIRMYADDKIEREIELTGTLSDAQRAKLLEVANKCPVHRTLHSEVYIPTSLKA